MYPIVINVTRHIKTVDPIRDSWSIYLDKECYFTRIYYRLWSWQRKETNLSSMTHFWWRHVLWAGIDEKLHHWLGTLVDGKNELLLLRTIFKKWVFKEASCCFYMVFTDSYLLSMDNISFFVEATTISIYERCFLFWRLGSSFNFQHSFDFQSFGQSNFSRHPFALTGDFVRLFSVVRVFLRHHVCDVNPHKKISPTARHHKGGTCSTWVVFTDRQFQPHN